MRSRLKIIESIKCPLCGNGIVGRVWRLLERLQLSTLIKNRLAFALRFSQLICGHYCILCDSMQETLSEDGYDEWDNLLQDKFALKRFRAE